MSLASRPRMDRHDQFGRRHSRAGASPRRLGGFTLVKEALARKVTAIAVTDHHDVCMATYVQAAAECLGGDVPGGPSSMRPADR
jgi:hypothetical protein